MEQGRELVRGWLRAGSEAIHVSHQTGFHEVKGLNVAARPFETRPQAARLSVVFLHPALLPGECDRAKRRQKHRFGLAVASEPKHLSHFIPTLPHTVTSELPRPSSLISHAHPSTLARWSPPPGLTSHLRLAYSDEKVANRDIRVWHGATENGP